MHDHDLKKRSQVAVKKIPENVANAMVTLGRGKNATIVHSKTADRSALDQAAQDRNVKVDMELIS